MYRVTDYSFLFQSMLGKNNMMNKNNISSMFGSIKVSDLSSKSVKKQLISAGIDINSKQYKTVASSMISANEGGGLYTNIQAIKNRMSQYDSDGNFTRDMGWLSQGDITLDPNTSFFTLYFKNSTDTTLTSEDIEKCKKIKVRISLN